MQYYACDSKSSGKVIQVVGVENEYADILKQIGGQYVSVTAIINNAVTGYFYSELLSFAFVLPFAIAV